MRRFVVCSLAALFGLAFSLAPQQAQAQFMPPQQRLNPIYRPPVSPYLNLLRPGTDPAINYYGLVRPQIDTRRSLFGLQQQVNTLGQGLGQSAATQDQLLDLLLSTGHPVRFFNTTHYFGNGLNPGTTTGVSSGNLLGSTSGSMLGSTSGSTFGGTGGLGRRPTAGQFGRSQFGTGGGRPPGPTPGRIR